MGTRAVNDMITRIVKTTRWISLPDFFIKGLVIGLKVKKIATFIDIHELDFIKLQMCRKSTSPLNKLQIPSVAA